MTDMQKNVTTESILSTPFSSYIIADEDEILYFTQSFAEKNCLNPSQSSLSLSKLKDRNLHLKKLENFHAIYDVFAGHDEKHSMESYRRIWSENLIHELRTSSLLMDLGSKSLLETSTKISLKNLYKTLRKTSNQQQVCTLIAADFIQLSNTNPVISPTSLSKIISKSWGSLQDPTRVQFNICLSDGKSNQFFNPNPFFYGNELFLINFFKTTLSWFENESVTVEIEQENRISMRISFSIPFDQYLSTLQNYRLVNQYLVYITAFYNLRCWITQSTLNITLPLIMN
ncbi:MAG: hypothetical protein ACXAB2_10125 [Candidatus Hodarchaeales archaeon]|jgi:hypothetical protein